jgi:hypothetical protein
MNGEGVADVVVETTPSKSAKREGEKRDLRPEGGKINRGSEPRQKILRRVTRKCGKRAFDSREE